MKVAPLKILSWYKVSDPRFHGASGAIISQGSRQPRWCYWSHRVSKVRRR